MVGGGETRSNAELPIGARLTDNCQSQLEAGEAVHISCANRATTNPIFRIRTAATHDWSVPWESAGVLPTKVSIMLGSGPARGSVINVLKIARPITGS